MADETPAEGSASRPEAAGHAAMGSGPSRVWPEAVEEERPEEEDIFGGRLLIDRDLPPF
ncbi:hypothetical protein [Sphaerimonospora mesophila]|uniref:hypothetical protein n=1 Tax=Sphaerimonospora mesophila TaxID=37483 RepID=UPI001F2AEFA6